MYENNSISELDYSGLSTELKELGLSIDVEDFGMEAAREENLAQIVKGVMSDTIPNKNCLWLLKHLVCNLWV